MIIIDFHARILFGKVAQAIIDGFLFRKAYFETFFKHDHPIRLIE